MKCYFCKKEFDSKTIRRTATFLNKEIYICEECEGVYKRVERTKLGSRQAIYDFEDHVTEHNTDKDINKEVEKYVAEALEANEQLFQERLAKGEVEKHELWQCYCKQYNLKEDDYCMFCHSKRYPYNWEDIPEHQKLIFYTSTTDITLETTQALEDKSNFSVNLLWIIPVGIFLLFTTKALFAILVLVAFTVWGLSGEQSYTEYYHLKDDRIRNDLRIHEVTARQRSEDKENRKKLKNNMKQSEFMEKCRRTVYMLKHKHMMKYKEREVWDRHRFVSDYNLDLYHKEKDKLWYELKKEKEFIEARYPAGFYAPIDRFSQIEIMLMYEPFDQYVKLSEDAAKQGKKELEELLRR